MNKRRKLYVLHKLQSSFLLISQPPMHCIYIQYKPTVTFYLLRPNSNNLLNSNQQITGCRVNTWVRLLFLSSRKWAKAWGSKPKTCMTCKIEVWWEWSVYHINIIDKVPFCTSCMRVAESSVSALAVKWRGATFTCPTHTRRWVMYIG